MTQQEFLDLKEKYIAKSMFADVSRNLVDAVLYMLNDEQVVLTWEQQSRLVSHLCLMVTRSRIGGQVPMFQPSMIEELSQESIALGERITKHFPTLAEVEKYLLAIHFDQKRI